MRPMFWTAMMPIQLPIDEPANRIYARFPGFCSFWEAYPDGKGSKQEAFKQWLKAGCEAYCSEIINDVKDRQANDGLWLAGYVPHARTYISQHRWADPLNPKRVDQQPKPRSDSEWNKWGQEQGVLARPGEDWHTYVSRLRDEYEKRAKP